MPFGLTNAPSVFQHLMGKVLPGLNLDEGPGYVAVYVDDVLAFSHIPEQHLQHMCSTVSVVPD